MQLIHGDCISAMEQLPDGSVDLILTDPPYNIKVKRTKNGKARTEEWDCIKDYHVLFPQRAAAKRRIEEEAANPYADNLTIWDDTLTRRACQTGACKQPQTSKSQ